MWNLYYYKSMLAWCKNFFCLPYFCHMFSFYLHANTYTFTYAFCAFFPLNRVRVGAVTDSEDEPDRVLGHQFISYQWLIGSAFGWHSSSSLYNFSLFKQNKFINLRFTYLADHLVGRYFSVQCIFIQKIERKKKRHLRSRFTIPPLWLAGPIQFRKHRCISPLSNQRGGLIGNLCIYF